MQRKKDTKMASTRSTRTRVKTTSPPTKVRSMTVRIPRELGWAATRTCCVLRFHKFFLLNNVGVNQANVRFAPVNCYDVDPTVGSTAMPGFGEWGAIYRLYRTNSAKLSVAFSSNETFPLVCYTCPVNTDPGANYASAVAQQYLANLLSKRKEIGPLTGNGICTVLDEQSTDGFAGAKNTKTIDNYTGSTNGGTLPTNQWYWTVGVVAPVAMVSGVVLDVYLDIEVDFFEVLSPAS